MELPTLAELGLEDKRRKVKDEVKKHIKRDLEKGITNMSLLARKYNVSIGTVRMIKNPEKERATFKRYRVRKGASLYNKDKQKVWCDNLSKRKLNRIKEIVKEYKKLKGV